MQTQRNLMKSSMLKFKYLKRTNLYVEWTKTREDQGTHFSLLTTSVSTSVSTVSYAEDPKKICLGTFAALQQLHLTANLWKCLSSSTTQGLHFAKKLSAHWAQSTMASVKTFSKNSHNNNNLITIYLLITYISINIQDVHSFSYDYSDSRQKRQQLLNSNCFSWTRLLIP